jgi:hypothetical protein
VSEAPPPSCHVRDVVLPVSLRNWTPVHDASTGPHAASVSVRLIGGAPGTTAEPLTASLNSPWACVRSISGAAGSREGAVDVRTRPTRRIHFLHRDPRMLRREGAPPGRRRGCAPAMAKAIIAAGPAVRAWGMPEKGSRSRPRGFSCGPSRLAPRPAVVLAASFERWGARGRHMRADSNMDAAQKEVRFSLLERQLPSLGTACSRHPRSRGTRRRVSRRGCARAESFWADTDAHVFPDWSFPLERGRQGPFARARERDGALPCRGVCGGAARMTSPPAPWGSAGGERPRLPGPARGRAIARAVGAPVM